MAPPDLPSPLAMEDIYRVAAELPAGKRPAYLEAVCEGRPEMRARIDRMLEVGGIAAFLQHGANETVPAEIETELAGLNPDEGGGRIGNYKLLQQIGEGGFGVVWMAEQIEPVRRRVALKILKLGMDTKEVIARFEQERQALAMMDHSNIAKVFDAGATPTGRPFFVMELVRGIKITDYCDQANLPTADRLALFIAVCRAVQHAHQKGIIHRDIKPSNILVTLHDGVPVPKVIDFGVAKATQSRALTDLTLFTQFEQMIGTPLYMSPEQAEMSGLDIDTRSDIYSLGVLLYELLTGRTPFDPEELMRKGYDEIRRVIREQEPQKPSTALSTMAVDARTTVAQHRQADSAKLLGLIRGDLDWIVMKALEKDRTRRYETASGLALDLQRHMQNEPVLARPPSFGYKAGKFVRKYRRGVIAAAAVLVALLAGLVASTVLYLGKRDALASESVQRQKAEASAQLAERNAQSEAAARQEAEAVSKYVTDIFQSPDPARDGRKITVAETLDRAARKLEADLASQPRQRARLQATLGETYAALGLPRDAIPLLEKSRDYCLATFGPEHSETLGAANNLAASYRDAGRLSEALKLQEEVLTLSRKALGPEHTDTIGSMSTLGLLYREAGRRDEALKLQEETLAFRRKALPPDDRDIGGAIHNLAISYHDAGRRDEALKMFEEALPLYRRAIGPEKPETLRAMSDLSESYKVAGRLEEALKMREELLELFRKVSGPEHPNTLQAKANLAESYNLAGRVEEALRMYEEVLALSLTVNGLEHPETLRTKINLAESYAHAGRQVEALKLREEVLAVRHEKLGPEHPGTLLATASVARSYAAVGRLDEARKLREEVLAIHRKVNREEHPETLVAMSDLAFSYAETGRQDEGLKLREEILALRRRVNGLEHPRTLEAMHEIVFSYAEMGRADEAITLREEVLALRRKVLGPEHPKTLAVWHGLVNAYYDANRRPEAEKLADDLLASLDENSHPREFASALRLRGGLRIRLRRWKEAAADNSRAVALDPEDQGVWYRLAPLLLHVGDTAGYRKHRQALLEKFRTTTALRTMERTARACLLIPVEGEELEAAGKLADAAATLARQHESRCYFQSTEGLAQYRQGKFSEAVSGLRDIVPERGDATLEIEIQTVLAMALHRLHQPVEARAALARASELVAAKLPRLDTGDLGATDWQETLIAHLLLREAQALLQVPDRDE